MSGTVPFFVAGGHKNGTVPFSTATNFSTVPMSHRLFFREFIRNYHTTGAILPSGRQLAGALARFVAQATPADRRILEVGPGTGAVTRRIIAAMRPGDTIDLVELNVSFVRKLEEHFQNDPHFRSVADRSRIINRPVQDLPVQQKYDLIVSGLPLNNFSVELVESILEKLTRLLKSGGTLSFFEYIAVRRRALRQRQGRPRTPAGHRPRDARRARQARNPPRGDLVQRAPGLGASRADGK